MFAAHLADFRREYVVNWTCLYFRSTMYGKRLTLYPVFANSVDPDQMASEEDKLIWIYTVSHYIFEFV